MQIADLDSSAPGRIIVRPRLERLKTKQTERAAKFEAASELAGSTEEVSLDAKLKAAGIVGGGASSGDVLARLKANRAN